MARHPTIFAGPAGPVGAAQEEHLLLQWNNSATGLHHTKLVHLRMSVYTCVCSQLHRHMSLVQHDQDS